MKYIIKGNEPTTLRDYRNTTPDASYKGFGDKDALLKKSLLEEQGSICAYCMRRISLKWNQSIQKPCIEVGHYIPQAVDVNKNLAYRNMLGVCNGDFGDKEHCDKSQKDNCLKILDPLNKDCEKRLTYTEDGRIKAVVNNVDVEHDIALLNLNDRNLVDTRKKVIDTALTAMVNKYPKKQWTKGLIQAEIDFWKERDRKRQFKPFCQIAIWFWEKQQQSNRYPTQ